MRVAALYDIHGNLGALDAVLAEVGRAGADEIVVGGDVLPGFLPRETLDRLRYLDVPARFIRGNGESAVLAQLAGTPNPSLPDPVRTVIEWVASQLQPSDRDLIAGWAPTCRATIPPLGRVLFCHATPRSDTEIFTSQTAEERLRPLFEEVDADIVVCGHTHMQFDRMIGSTRVVNAGSVGMPFGAPGADWLLLGPTVDLRHTDYDVEAAANRARATSYPGVAEFVQRYLLRPPAAADMLAAFSTMELRG